MGDDLSVFHGGVTGVVVVEVLSPIVNTTGLLVCLVYIIIMNIYVNNTVSNVNETC